MLALFSSSSFAQTQSAWNDNYLSAGQPQVLPATPDQILRQGLDRLNGFMLGGGTASPERVRSFLDAHIAPHFDFDYMAWWAAGGFHRRLEEQHRVLLTARLREMFLGALARNIGAYAQPLPDVQVFPARPGSTPHEALVDARVFLPASLVMRLQFRFYWDGSHWRAFDAVANGASAVTFYRDYFGDLIRRHGPEVALR